MRFLSITLLLIFASINTLSEEIRTQSEEVSSATFDDELSYNISFGVSAFECVLGVEIQKRVHSFGLGICGQISYRYYSRPYGDSPLYGLIAGLNSGYERHESRNEIDGILYEDKESKYAGIGAGYRWQWSSGWNVTTSLVVVYEEEEYSSIGLPKVKESSVFLFPGITAGYKF